LENVDVQVFKADGDFVGEGFTGPGGTYTVSGLASATGYRVCFRGSDADGGPSAAGYLDECYDNIPWTNGDPSIGTPVRVVAGADTSGIDAGLADAGGVAGQVTSSVA